MDKHGTYRLWVWPPETLPVSLLEVAAQWVLYRMDHRRMCLMGTLGRGCNTSTNRTNCTNSSTSNTHSTHSSKATDQTRTSTSTNMVAVT